MEQNYKIVVFSKKHGEIIMKEKKCPTCGSDMGVGASAEKNVKALYECWCGTEVVEFYSDEELPKIILETPQSNAASAAV